MKTWTYLEVKTKVEVDMDLQDEDFITPDELVGYCNEGIKEAYAEIVELHQDYFLSSDYVKLVSGTGEYPMPDDIYGNKLRGVIYQNGSLIYPVTKIRRMGSFEVIATTDLYGSAQPYQYYIQTDSYGTQKFVLSPVSRDSDPLGSSKLMRRWYQRASNRVAMIGEYCNPEGFLPAAVNIATDVITVIAGTTAAPGTTTYVTGDQVKFTNIGGTLPTGITAGVTYFVIALSPTTIKLATTLILARAGTAIDLTAIGSGLHQMKVAATLAIQNNTLVDIPEFIEFVMQWMKCRVFEKDGDPRYDSGVAELQGQRKMMQDTLNQMVDDDDDTITADFSFYQDMS